MSVPPAEWLLDPAMRAALRGALALVLAMAAVHKLGDRRGFESALAGYALLPAAAVPTAAVAFALLELGLAAALLAHPAAAPALGAVALLGLYSGAIAWSLLRGRRDIDCGCGGAAGRQRVAPALLARNALLVAAALAAAAPASARSLGALDLFTVGALAVALVLLHAALDVAIANAAPLRMRRAAAGGR